MVECKHLLLKSCNYNSSAVVRVTKQFLVVIQLINCSCLCYIHHTHTNSGQDLYSHSYIHIGERSPGPLSSLHAINVGLTSATIQWTVSIIRYTPETYTVWYGTSIYSYSSLRESEPVESGSDFVTPNQTFSVNLTGLLPATEYSFWVVPRNDYYSYQYSYLSTFITGGTGKCVLLKMCFSGRIYCSKSCQLSTQYYSQQTHN